MSAGLTLDTGALIALERGDRRVLALVDRAARVTVPTPVVVEWWRGQRGPAAHLLDPFDVEALEEALARRAAMALREVGAGPSVTDAVVMASAAARGDLVLSGDLPDLERLRAVFPSVRLLRT